MSTALVERHCAKLDVFIFVFSMSGSEGFERTFFSKSGSDGCVILMLGMSQIQLNSKSHYGNWIHVVLVNATLSGNVNSNIPNLSVNPVSVRSVSYFVYKIAMCCPSLNDYLDIYLKSSHCKKLLGESSNIFAYLKTAIASL